MTVETGGNGGTEEGNTEEATPPMQTGEAAARAPEAEVTAQAGPQVEGRRTQLRILRENIQSLSKDVGNFRKSHEGSTKRLEKEVATLRDELAALKSNIAKDAARSREKQEAILSRILAKVSKGLQKRQKKKSPSKRASKGQRRQRTSARTSKPARSTKKR